MVIANPIYDVVFKKLMENEKVAKFFIGTMLNQTIESVEVSPQEFTYIDKNARIALLRLDFIATVKTENGGFKKVLIEIQKARHPLDIMRFRNYLAEQYKKEDKVNNQNRVLPITTIYILGFDLPEIETPCIKVERNYKDLINNTTLSAKSQFVENLTHDSYVVQVERIKDRYQTRLDKLLSVFEQNHFIEDRKITKEFLHETDLEEVKIMTDILHYVGTEPKEKKKIETEQEAWRTLTVYMGEEREKLLVTLHEKNKEIAKKETVIAEKETVIAEKETVIAETMQELAKKESVIEATKQELAVKDLALLEKEKAIEALRKEMEELRKMKNP